MSFALDVFWTGKHGSFSDGGVANDPGMIWLKATAISDGTLVDVSNAPKAPTTVTVPNYVGGSFDSVQAAPDGLRLRAVCRPGRLPDTLIYAQAPVGHTKVRRGSLVTLYYNDVQGCSGVSPILG